MKKILFLSVVVCSLICFSCNDKKINNASKETSGIVFKVDSDVILKNKESATLDSKDLVIEVLEINDSRCPVGVNCIRAGEVTFSLLLKSKDSELKTALSYPVKGNKVKGSASFAGYHVQLTGATQKNDEKLNAADLAGIFVVTKKDN